MASGMKLFIATPILTEPKFNFFDSMMRFCAAYRGKFMFRQIVGGMIGLARDNAASEFLKTDCTDLLFIDSDIAFTVADVDRICSHDLDVVGGCYPLKQEAEKPTLVLSLVDGAKHDENGLIECTGIGTGFLRIRRSVFEKLAPHAKTFKNDKGETEQDFFPSGVDDGKYWGEDLAFCRLWRKHGGKVWADYQIRLSHFGVKIFRCEPGKAQTTKT